MTNLEIFTCIEQGNSRPVLKYFSDFADSFYFFCKKQDKLKLLNRHQIKAVFDDACIYMYDKIEAKKITLRQMTSSVKTLIFAVGKNMAFQQGRNEMKYYSLHVFLEDSSNQIANLGNYNDPDSFQEIRLQQLDKALLSLSDKHHALIVEGVMEGKSNSQIAREQNYSSANAVSVEKLRAYKVLEKTIYQIREDDKW